MTNKFNENSANIHSSDNKIVDSDLFYRSLFEHNLDIVFFLDTKGTTVKSNKIFSEILGYTNDEIVLGSMKRFLPASEIPLYREHFNLISL